jgi:hypothetical protein
MTRTVARFERRLVVPTGRITTGCVPPCESSGTLKLPAVELVIEAVVSGCSPPSK